MHIVWDDDANLCLQPLLILYHTQNAIRGEKLFAMPLRRGHQALSVFYVVAGFWAVAES